MTLRIAAKYAQYTNFTPESAAFVHKSEVLAGHCRDVGTDFDAIVRSVNVNAVVGTSEADVKDRMQRIRDRMVGYIPEAAADAMVQWQRTGFSYGHNGTGDRARLDILAAWAAST